MNEPVTITLRGLEPVRLRYWLSQLLNDTGQCACPGCSRWAESTLAAEAPFRLLPDHDDADMDVDELPADVREALYTLEAGLMTGLTLRDKGGNP